MAGSATPTRLLATATVVALLAVGCTRDHQPTTGSGPIDPAVLELVAPVGGESLRASARLDEQIARATWTAQQRCLEGRGFHDLPKLQYARGRFFDFPDAQDLRAHAFHSSVDPGPTEDDGDGPARGAAFERDLRACAEDANGEDSLNGARRRLMGSWMEVFLQIKNRPEEAELWRASAECLAARGYARAGLDTEASFLGSVDGLVRAATELAEQQRRERKAANDYVDCVEPVWTARTKAAKAARERWVEQHDEELRALSRQLRDLG
jgi:hypothetical protein